MTEAGAQSRGTDVAPAHEPFRCQARLRYRQPLQDCTVTAQGDGLRVDFDVPQRAVAPGQFAVFYAGEECLGGAVISE
jgi:tRNA-specific 2-thiouridylase